MKKIIDILKKYKLSVIIALLIIIVGIIGIIIFNLIFNKSPIKNYENKYYLLQYDSGWSLKQKDDSKILLNHGKNAKLNIEIITLENESKYASIDDLIEEIEYNIENQNSSYKLISKKDAMISKYEFKGYKLLFENENSQAMTYVYKKSDKLIMFNYEADNEYFDILLDSVHSIIFNFDTKEEKYDLGNKITLNTTNDISYSSDEELDKLINKQMSYELAESNYYVKYSVPSSFELSSFDSTRNYFNFRGNNDKKITISSDIYKYNIFEYLDKSHNVNVYKNYDIFKNDEDYSDFVESIAQIDEKKDNYIYKNSYNYNKAVTYDKDFKKQEYKRKDENVMLIYALDKNHILIIEIKATGTAITEKLINNIKIEEIKNYSSYVTSKKVDGQLVSNLKRYDGYDKKKIDMISLKIPDKYQEFEKGNNIYSDRYFGLNYDEEKNIYDYEIHYELTTSSSKIESKIDSLNSSFSKAYGVYNYLTNSGEIVLNNYKFNLYTGGYTQLGGIMFTNINRFRYYTNKKVLFYELSNGGYLVIEISGNGKEITNEILNDATNFKINEIDN